MYATNRFFQIRVISILPIFLLTVLFVIINTGAVLAQELAPIASREYKVMLKAKKFKGNVEDKLPLAIKNLEQKLANKLSDSPLPLEGSFGEEPEDNRIVRYWDTTDKDLRSHGFVLRERGDLDLDTMTPKEGKTKYTLKFRSPDQFPVARKNVLLNEDDYNLSKIKYKFEEDISPIIITVNFAWLTLKETNRTDLVIDTKNNWRSLFSFSGTGRDKDDAVILGTLSDAVDLYPGLSNGLSEEGYTFDASNAPALEIVSDIEVYERKYEGMTVDLGDGIEAELELTIWYNMASSAYNRPALTELSFSYKRIDDDVLVGTANAARNAKLLFETILGMNLVDISSSTKTAFVYSYSDHP